MSIEFEEYLACLDPEDHEHREGIESALESLDEGKKLRALVFKAEGKAFSAGVDSTFALKVAIDMLAARIRTMLDLPE